MAKQNRESLIITKKAQSLQQSRLCQLDWFSNVSDELVMAPTCASLRRSVRGGFTLIEAAVTTSIVGIGFLAVMELFTACTRQTVVADHTTTALMLTGQIEEMLTLLPMDDPTVGSQLSFGPEEATLAEYDDVDDFAGIDGGGMSFNPPIDCRRQPITSLGSYTQKIKVIRVLPDALGVSVGGYSGACRVEMVILYSPVAGEEPAEVYRQSFVRFDE